MSIDSTTRSTAAGSESKPRSVAFTALWPASVGLGVRNVRNIRRLPSAFLPSLLMPIIQAVAFSGTFYAVTQIPGFPTDRSINWFLPLGVMMGCGFAGIGVGLTTVRDIESGFYDRLRMTPMPRLALITGPTLGALARAMVVITAVFLVGLLIGARLTDGVIGLLTLYIAGLGVAALGTFWGLALAYRFRDMRGAAIMQLTFFLALFLTDAQTPLSVMEGWLHGVARVNPFTNILRLGRQGFLGDVTWADTWGGLVAIAAICAVTLWFAASSLNRLRD
ncbi:MAG: ABC transporter permease [Actinomycetota bacterium]